MKKRTLGRVIGSGLLAGAAGTAAMTAVQRIEMRMRNRPASKLPAKAVEKLMHIEPKNERAEQRLSTATHWTYGSSLGLIRAALRELGLGPIPATLAHLGIVWGGELRMLPSMNLVPPLRMWSKKEFAMDLLHHAIYAAAVGATFDTMYKRHKVARGLVPVAKLGLRRAARKSLKATRKATKPLVSRARELLPERLAA